MAARVEPVTTGLPIVAIVGRPNVGKSTLFNRIVRSHRAIVDDAPGVTRDRVVAPATYEGRAFLCVDTGGFLAENPRDPTAIEAQVRAQALAAVEEAHALVCVVDGHAGLAPVDRETVRLLARSAKPLFVVVNKIDGPTRDGLVHDFHALGVDRLFPVSGAHNRGIDELLDAVVAALPVCAVSTREEGTRVALVGRPNVGKSSLLNRLLGAERALVSPKPGTTRDAIDTPVTVQGRPYVLIDTAGIRRRSRVESQLERHGAVRALGTLARTDVALVVVDATEGMTDQDARIVGRALEAGRGVVLLANKWDLVRGVERDVKRFRERVRGLNPGFADLPLLCVSASTGEGLEALFNQVTRVEQSYRATVATPVLNKTLQGAVTAHHPPSPHGRAIKLFYATQTAVAPPELTIFTNAPGSIPADYTRYLTKRFADAFDLVGVPIRIRYRPRRAPDAETASARPRRGSAAHTRRSSRPRSAGARAPRR
jgi:GTP-binding protein